jgi:tetratricopeptide (TPR) repeat protein
LVLWIEPLTEFLLVPDWQQYEREIEEQFRETYPSARITHNAKLVGKFSKVERQIDLLIEEQASDFAFRIVVDAKCRGRKIDVGDVEAFLGLTRDVEAHTGMMIALEGYTLAAVNRAHYDDLDVILDVLNLDELKAFQGLTAIPYAGEHGVVIGAPFGWVADATKRQGMLATLYERGLTFEEALHNNEFMYINFWNKKDKNEVNNLDALLKHQEAYLLEGSPGAEIRLLEGVPSQKVGARTLIRRFKKKTYPVPEYTGFVDFENFVFMCVLFTPEPLERKNLRKLRFVLREAFPMTVTRDNTAVIKAAQEKLKESLPDTERARLLSEIGCWYRDMGQMQEARQALEASLALAPSHYETVKQLLATLTRLGDKTTTLELMSRLLRLAPHNPTVFDDCISYARRSTVSCSELLDLLEALKRDYPDDDLIRANCDFYAGKILLDADPVSARKRFVVAQASFRKLFPRGHQVFAALRSALRQLSRAGPPIPPSHS